MGGLPIVLCRLALSQEFSSSSVQHVSPRHISIDNDNGLGLLIMQRNMRLLTGSLAQHNIGKNFARECILQQQTRKFSQYG